MVGDSGASNHFVGSDVGMFDVQEINKPKKAEAIIKPVSNIYGEDANGRPIYIDRLYGSITGQHELINKNGTVYKGKINRKRRLVKLKQINGTVNNVYSVCFQTTDGRWFNNCGMPIEAPKKVEEDEQEINEKLYQ